MVYNLRVVRETVEEPWAPMGGRIPSTSTATSTGVSVSNGTRPKHSLRTAQPGTSITGSSKIWIVAEDHQLLGLPSVRFSSRH